MIGTATALITSAIIATGTAAAQTIANRKAQKSAQADATAAHNEELDRAAREDAARIAANKPFRDRALRILAQREARGGALPDVGQFSYTQPQGTSPSEGLAEASLAAIGQRYTPKPAGTMTQAGAFDRRGGPSPLPQAASPVPPAATSMASIGQALGRPVASRAPAGMPVGGAQETLAAVGRPAPGRAVAPPGFVLMRSPDGVVKPVPQAMAGYWSAKGAQQVA